MNDMAWPWKLLFAFVDRAGDIRELLPIAPVHAQRGNDAMWEGLVASALTKAWVGGKALEITNYRGWDRLPSGLGSRPYQ